MFRRLISHIVFILLLYFMVPRYSSTVDHHGLAIRIPDDYETIQKAINAANPGDTIFIAPGTYSENVLVNKTVSLVGEDQNSTVINMHSDRFANESATALEVTADGVFIENLTVTNATKAIWVNQANNVSIHSCSIVSNIWGIWLQNSTECSIRDNMVFDNWGGDSNLGYGAGIDLYNSNNSIIAGNYVSSGNLVAIWLGLSHNNKVENNTCVNNKSGIGLDRANENTVEDNTVLLDDILVSDSSHNLVKRNRVLDGGGIGVGDRSFSNMFADNVISGNMEGIHIEKTQDFFIGNLITNNTFGIAIHFCNGSTFYHNTLINNTINFPKDVYANFNTFDNGFEGNYWDNYTGVDANQDGIGDTPHQLDGTNVDRYPLMAPISFFDAGAWNDTQQQISIISNSTITSFQVNTTSNTLSFNVSGETPTIGFCRLAIPIVIAQQMWNNNYTILIDDQPANITNNWTDTTTTYIYITYQHSEHEITIIPELTQCTLLSLLTVATAISILLRRKPKQKPTH
jgi:nitrous oxidase accessory protein